MSNKASDRGPGRFALNRQRVFQLDLGGRPTVIVTCDRCEGTAEHTCSPGTPPNVAAKWFRDKGWKIRGEGKRAICPTCQVTPAQPAPAAAAAPPLPPASQISAEAKVCARPGCGALVPKGAIAYCTSDCQVQANRAGVVTRRRKSVARDALEVVLADGPMDAREATRKAAELGGVTQGAVKRVAPQVADTSTKDSIVWWQLKRAAPPSVTSPSKEVPVNPTTQPASQLRSVDAIRGERKLYRILEEHFEADAGRYREGYSDRRVAKETGLSLERVVAIRESAFGKLADPEHVSLRRDLDRLAKDMRDAVAQYRSHVDDTFGQLEQRLASLQSRLTKLEGAG